MQATRAPARSHRASRVIAALPVIATTFFMHAMVWRYFRQLKMPRPDAYDVQSVSLSHRTFIPARLRLTPRERIEYEPQLIKGSSQMH